MSNAIDICNMALSHIGSPRIQAFSDRTKQGYDCTLHYEPVRDSVLRAFPWNFAKKRKVLSLKDDSVSGWEYVYAYPTDCLRALDIYNPLISQSFTDGYYDNGLFVQSAVQVKADRIKFEVSLNEENNRRILLTNQEDAELVYIARVTDPNVFDTEFTKALAYALAAELAIPQKGDPRLQEVMLRNYQMILGQAQKENANEQFDTPTNVSAYITARM
jgi:hypothetical protein